MRLRRFTDELLPQLDAFLPGEAVLHILPSRGSETIVVKACASFLFKTKCAPACRYVKPHGDNFKKSSNATMIVEKFEMLRDVRVMEQVPGCSFWTKYTDPEPMRHTRVPCFFQKSGLLLLQVPESGSPPHG
jgi:hypothetical protein